MKYVSVVKKELLLFPMEVGEFEDIHATNVQEKKKLKQNKTPNLAFYFILISKLPSPEEHEVTLTTYPAISSSFFVFWKKVSNV